MSLFRKKPVVIEAFRYITRGPGAGRYFHDMPQWLESAYEDGVVSNVIRDEQHQLKIKTLEGYMYADAYDWIIRVVKGEIYSCKPDIFDATYEEVILRPSDPDAVRALEEMADAIDEARYQHPDHPRERPRPFSEADRHDREYALRLARAALAAHRRTPAGNADKLTEIIGHLGAVLIQTIPSDDQIIIGHVRDAHELACQLRRQK